MGISNLLPLLTDCMSYVHISAYAGHIVAVDASCWLHRGAFKCARQLAMHETTMEHIQYCLERVNMLKRCGVIPLLVFDGKHVPAKARIDDARAEERHRFKEMGKMWLKQGLTQKADKAFMKAVKITPEHCKMLQLELDKIDVEYIVAPYESDAQLAWVAHYKNVHCVITEDSDMIPFGCKRMLFKMDKGGNGQELRFRNLGQQQKLPMQGWTLDMVQTMCVLAGCDYSESLNGLGIKRAHHLVATHKNVHAVLRALQLETGRIVRENYAEEVHRALQTFRHQYIYNSIAKNVEPLQEIPQELLQSGDDLSFLGQPLTQDIAQGVCTGMLHPWTYQPWVDLEAVATQMKIKLCEPTKQHSDQQRQTDVHSVAVDETMSLSCWPHRSISSIEINPKAELVGGEGIETHPSVHVHNKQKRQGNDNDLAKQRQQKHDAASDQRIDAFESSLVKGHARINGCVVQTQQKSETLQLLEKMIHEHDQTKYRKAVQANRTHKIPSPIKKKRRVQPAIQVSVDRPSPVKKKRLVQHRIQAAADKLLTQVEHLKPPEDLILRDGLHQIDTSPPHKTSSANVPSLLKHVSTARPSHDDGSLLEDVIFADTASDEIQDSSENSTLPEWMQDKRTRHFKDITAMSQSRTHWSSFSTSRPGWTAW